MISTHTWLNLVAGMAIFSTVVVCCTVTLALLHMVHSLHQDTKSAARLGQTYQVAARQSVAGQPACDSPCTCLNQCFGSGSA